MLRAAALLFALTAAPARAADADTLPGTWLFESAGSEHKSMLNGVWNSKVTLTKDGFTISRFCDTPRPLEGVFTLDASTTPKSIDLHPKEFDLSDIGFPGKVPADKLPGIYKLEGDRLTVCFNTEAGGPRPVAFDAAGEKEMMLVLRKAEAGFKEFPKTVTTTVRDPAGKPVSGTVVGRSMNFWPKNGVIDAPREWTVYKAQTTGQDGTVNMPYADLEAPQLIARDPDGKRVGITALSPASLQNGTATITLVPACRVVGTTTCEELRAAGKDMGWTNVMLFSGGAQVASCVLKDGRFEFAVPAGEYRVMVYGTNFHVKRLPLTVPKGRDEFTLPPTELKAARLALLKGKPAPELAGVIGWKGKPVKFADLKGQYVLLEFWGYWCGPCVASMPVLLELHEKFDGKGVTIVGVHVDVDGEIDTAAKLDAKLVGIRKELWNGKDVPFPVALTSGKLVGQSDTTVRGLAAEQYGVVSYPKAILIDPEGNVVGEYSLRGKTEIAGIQKLLEGRKKK